MRVLSNESSSRSRFFAPHYDSSQKITQDDIDNLKACVGKTKDISLEVIARTVVKRELDREKARVDEGRAWDGFFQAEWVRKKAQLELRRITGELSRLFP